MFLLNREGFNKKINRIFQQGSLPNPIHPPTPLIVNGQYIFLKLDHHLSYEKRWIIQLKMFKHLKYFSQILKKGHIYAKVWVGD